MEAVDILMVGHFAKDELIVDGQCEKASGGGVYYGSMALRQMGLRVAVATRLHPDDFSRLDEMRAAGIQVFAHPAAQTSGIANYYQSSDMERRICKPIGFAGTMSIDEIPDIPAKAIIIAGIIAGEVDLNVVRTLATRAPLGLDVQGFVRVPEGDDLVFKPWADLAEGLRHVTYLKVDRAEAEHITGETDLRAAARALAAYGPREIVLTQSSGPTVYADGQFYQGRFTPRSLAGRTGRGDTCFSSYIGRRLTHTPAEATAWSAALTTLKQEKPGPWQGTLDEVERQMRAHAEAG
jgi:sugar/nucleoside kinase (ribokinase family)